jgi:CRP-like cAMP-binding protein/Fe-S-cluster-containing hydrogenase component 2
MSAIAPTTVEQLKAIPLLQPLGEGVLNALRPHVYECTYTQGERILREGEYCDGAYYLLDGQVSVTFGGPPVAEPRRSRGSGVSDPDASVVLAEMPVSLEPGGRAVLKAGEIFGEGSALSRYPIATDIDAVDEVRCLLIRTPALRRMLDEPELASFKALFDDRYRQRTLRAHFARVDLFKDLNRAIVDRLVDAVELVSFKPGRLIAEQGAPADAFYLVRGGYVKVGVKLGASVLTATYLRKGDWVGETAVLLDEPWPFSLTALEHVELVKLSREQMRQTLREVPGLEERLWTTMTDRLKRVARSGRDPLSAQPLQYAVDSGLIHGESVLLINLETCTRCDECVRACADVHDGTPRFIREGAKFRNFSVPTACYQCTDPVCMIGCPTGAITRPLGTREVVIDKATCIGCGNCVRRCPWGNIQQLPYDSPSLGKQIELASKCDLCVGRRAGPACVQMCPHGAAIRIDFKQFDRVHELFTQ